MSAWETASNSIDTDRNDWHTPAHVFDALGCTFDLDVSAPRQGPLHVPCVNWLWHHGLEQNWDGFVWMNPPYGHQENKRAWLRKFFDHGNGIALMPDRTSAPWFQEYAPKAHLLLFVNGKIKFEKLDGSVGKQPGNGTVLMAAGERALIILKLASQRGLGFVVSPVFYMGQDNE